MRYKEFIQDNFSIINKESQVVPFILNHIQNKYLQEKSNKDIILKARQQGFSSLILAEFAADFLLVENSRLAIVADISDNAEELLERAKFFIKSYEQKWQLKVPLKYNSKYELVNRETNSKYTIGTAENYDFGRSKTITKLHLSECAFYKQLNRVLAAATQAAVPTGRIVLETTANGFNDFKKLWDETVLGETGFKPLFYKASDFYNSEFLEQKKKELREMYPQEYPETAEEAFLSSGELFFDREALKNHLNLVAEPIKDNLIYV